MLISQNLSRVCERCLKKWICLLKLSHVFLDLTSVLHIYLHFDPKLRVTKRTVCQADSWDYTIKRFVNPAQQNDSKEIIRKMHV